MEKIKKFVKKNQILLIAVCVCIAALTVAFFAGGNRSENKVQTASTASSLSTTNADTETTSVSATEKTTQSPTDSAKSNKDKKDRKNSEDKKNSKDNSQNSNSSAVVWKPFIDFVHPARKRTAVKFVEVVNSFNISGIIHRSPARFHMNIVVLTNFYKDIIYRFALFELNLLFFEDYTVLWNEFNFFGIKVIYIVKNC